MKKLLLSLAIASSVAVPAWSQPVRDAETNLRCSIPADAAIYARQAGILPVISRGTPITVRGGEPVPTVMVDGWSPPPGPLNELLTQLGSEAGFAVVGAQGMPQVSWAGGKAPLSDVLDNLTKQANASWSFSSGVLRVAPGQPVISVPASMRTGPNRDATLALLDTLRGYNANPVKLQGDGISFSASSQNMDKIVSGLSGASEIFVFDVSFYRGRPAEGRYNWSALGPVSMTAEGAGGRMMLGEDGSSKLSAFLSSSGDVQKSGSQTVAGPSGWSLVVPESQCGNGSRELTLRPKRTGDGFSLRLEGFGAPTDVPIIALGQTLALAAPSPNGGWIEMVTIRPRILSVR